MLPPTVGITRMLFDLGVGTGKMVCLTKIPHPLIENVLFAFAGESGRGHLSRTSSSHRQPKGRRR